MIKKLENTIGTKDVVFASEEINRVVEASVGLALDRFVSAGSDVRRDDAIGGTDENVTGRWWFGVENVGSIPAYLATLESAGDVVGVDEFAAGAVEDNDPVAHFGDLGGVNHVFGFLGEETMERDDIGVVQNLVHVSALLDAMLFAKGFVEVGVEGDDFHAEGSGAYSDLLADASEAEDTDGLTHNFVTYGLFPSGDPLAILHGDGIGLDVFGDTEKESEGVFSDGGMIDAGGKEDGDFFFGGVFDIDLVEADAVFGNSLKAGERLVDDGGSDGVISTKKGVEVAGKIEHFCFGKWPASAYDLPVLRVEEILVCSRSILKRRRGEENSLAHNMSDRSVRSCRTFCKRKKHSAGQNSL